VIAIIAILAAILFPVFAKAREKARQTSCLSNIKQIALSARMYIDDYDGQGFDWWYSAPGATSSYGNVGWIWWMDMIRPYMKNTQMFSCPSRRLSYSGWNNLISDYYMYDGALAGAGTEANPYWRGFSRALNDSQVVSPSDFAWFMEGLENNSSSPGWRTAPIISHNDGLNVGFFDGHGKWLHRQALGTAKTQRPSGLWVWTYWISDR